MARLFKPSAIVTLFRPDETYFATPGANAVVVGNAAGTGLEVAFSITKNLGSEPNKCEIRLLNLNPESRAACAKKPLSAVIAAGYDGETKRLFYGDVTWADTTHDGTTFETTLLLADGDRAYRYARLSKSYGPGAKVADVARDAAKAMGLLQAGGLAGAGSGSLLEVPEFDPRLVSERGFTYAQAHAEFERQKLAYGKAVHGAARKALTDVLAPYGFQWSIQDGRLVVLRNQDVRPGESWPVGEQHGLKGQPEVSPPDKKNGAQKLTLRCALYPELSPGGTLKLTSRKMSGSFKIERVTHDGGPHDEWTTEVECKVRS